MDQRPLEASLLCLKSVLQAAPDNGPDQVADWLLAQARVTLFDLTRLLVHAPPRVGDGDVLEIAYEGERYDAVLTELAKRLSIDSRLRATFTGPPRPEPKVRLFGHFGSTVGIGQSARGTAAALATGGIDFAVVALHWFDEHQDPTPVPPPPDPATAVRAVRPLDLIHLNPGDLTDADGIRIAAPGLSDGQRAFTIGIWAWETLIGTPTSWRAYYSTYDEIWTPSAHARTAIAKTAPVPVVVMPHVIAPPAPTLDRVALGLPADTFIFFFAFDANSNFERKNPAGLIAAYRQAFPTPKPGVMLLLKARSLSAERLNILSALADGRDDILIVAESWSSERLFSVMAACDCYVSLHRAEGFGRTMAEAMYYGKPVIATAYSGNLDFMPSGTAYLVPYGLTTLHVANGDYEAGTVWADPNIEQAAMLMAQIQAGRAEAAATGERAAAWVRTNLSAEASGRRIRERLAELELIETAPGAAKPRRRRRADPKVLVLTPVKDARACLPRYIELLRGLDYDPARLSLAFLESDSRDGGYAALSEATSDLASHFRRVELHRFDFGFQFDGPRWDRAIQRRRREIIARSRNRLLNAGLREEDWVLWLDADLTDYPPDLLRRLLSAEKDIVVPHCVNPDGGTFDLNTFCFSPDSGRGDDPRHLVDGLFQPPRGTGRLYLDAFQDKEIVPIDSVGGTALLIRGDLHREGLNFPPFSYRGYIETEGLAMMARDMGYSCWGMPRLTIVHG